MVPVEYYTWGGSETPQKEFQNAKKSRLQIFSTSSPSTANNISLTFAKREESLPSWKETLLGSCLEKVKI